MNNYYIYIMGNWTGDVLYTGITNNLERRLYEHQHKTASKFTKKYNVDKLLYLETYDNPTDAIAREKQIKNWRKEKKIFLIQQLNPDWKDLSKDWYSRSLDYARDDKV